MKITKSQLRSIVEGIGAALTQIVFDDAPKQAAAYQQNKHREATMMTFESDEGDLEEDDLEEEEDLNEMITKRRIRQIVKEACGDISLEKEPGGEIYGHGGKSRMAKSQLFQIATNAAELHDILDEEDELPEWVQSKIAVIEDNLDAVLDHLEYKHRSHLGGEELDFTGDVGELPGDEAFGIGYEAGRRNL